ncbi:MAG TPA: tyrosine-type recombinase/integrase [Methanotrichaceae archaeon]|nr:tyrosine-type recombinase/integrase [Methanotrichaceae archaeon]HQF15478.1 tyrosine-type recombinase/integrase [Methanotrichaceae archaeon]HQI90213.1 tyrosine-type recombinase/integrase [Methanotrichaceae archaeon]HQJ27818.1 tyrosine-type recombinase/integrase [Methanotrichaceae archaeon]
MPKKRLDVNWDREAGTEGFKPALKRFERYLKANGLSPATIEMYVFRVGKYLEFVRSDTPSDDDFLTFRDMIQEAKLSRSTINNYLFSIKKYYEMLGRHVEFIFIRPKNIIPYYFEESEIARIFISCYNIKHLAMLQTMFYASLRASELCDLDDGDLDVKSLTIRVRNGKGGKDAMVYITDDCAKTLRRYLEVRAPLVIDGRKPLFYTDFGGRWERRGVYRMFMYYKKLAGIEKHGGVHVFSRHSVGSLLIKRGCDIVTIKELMRHSDVNTTMRYLHVSDATKREKYEQFLRL